MNLILTMAGKYSRFVIEGYKFPKYLLPWGHHTILSKILGEMTKGNYFENVFLIANINDETYAPHVLQTMDAYQIPRENLHLISDTGGQAETAHVGIKFFRKIKGNNQAPVVFHNIDTILYKRDFRVLIDKLSQYDGYIDVFNSNNHAHSYVLMENDRVAEIAEKIVISNHATSGLYGFKNAELFEKFYEPEVDIYISGIYDKMINAGLSIGVGELHNEHDTVVLGTPEEYINASVMIDKLA